LKGLDVETFEGDLADSQALNKAAKGINTVFHTGGVKSNSTWQDIYKTNIKGTENLINAALANRVERVILISDTEVYDLISVKKGTLIREDSPFQKNPNAYVYSKIRNEKDLFEAHKKHGLGATVIRPGMVIGPMGQMFFPHLGYRYKNKIFFIIRNGKNILPLICVQNLVDGIYNVSIEKKAVGQVYNLVDDLEITVRSYLEHFIRITGSKARIISLPYIVPYLAIMAYEIIAHMGFVKRGVTSRSQFKWKHTSMLFDNTKAKKDLGWSPTISMEEGLTKTFRWYAESESELYS